MRPVFLRVAAVTAVALLTTACSSEPEGPSVTTIPPNAVDSTVTTLQPGTVDEQKSTVPPQLDAFARDVVHLDGEALTVAVADTSALRSQGLVGVEDLGPLEGMLFVFQDDTTVDFHMEDTLMPLDIAFFTEDGRLVSTTRMVPCVTDSCPDYESDGPYRYALEAPAGALIPLDPDTTLAISTG